MGQEKSTLMKNSKRDLSGGQLYRNYRGTGEKKKNVSFPKGMHKNAGIAMIYQENQPGNWI